MLKRLFIAVFALGLVIGLNGTAKCDAPHGSARLTPYTPNTPVAEHMALLKRGGPTQPNHKLSLDNLRPVLPGVQIPAQRQTYFCDEQDYTSGALAYYWTVPDQLGYGEDLYNVRFTSDPDYDCSLMVAHLLMYAAPQVGAPTMRVYLWDDDGFGFPGAKLDSVDITAPGDGLQGQNTAYYVDADFSTGNNGGPWVFSNGAEYHIGWTSLGDSTTVLACLSDAADGPYAGQGRNSEWLNGDAAWGTMLNNFGVDFGFFISAERCCSEIPYSDCHTDSYWTNLAYIWDVPASLTTDSSYASRFDISGPETLVSIDVGMYDLGDGQFGTADLFVTIYDDDAGLPGAQLAQVEVPAGTYPAFPAMTNVPIPGPLVVTNDFHVGISTDGTIIDSNGVGTAQWMVSSDGTDGDLRTSAYHDTDGAGDWGWVLMSEHDFWQFDCQWLMDANLCKDQYSDCSVNSCYNGSPAYVFNIPDPYGDAEQAVQFTGVGEQCRIQDVNLLLYWSRFAYDLPLYSAPTNIVVWADAGGEPGAELGHITVNPADYGITAPADTAGPSHTAWLTVDFQPLGIYVTGAYWVGIQAITQDPDSGIYVMSDAGGGACTDNWDVYHDGTLEPPAGWRTMQYWYGVGDDWAMFLSSEHCCIPFSERTCTTPFDWSTLQGDQARDGASFVPMSDSWCDLTLNWHFEHPSQGVTVTGPVVYGDYVICSFTTEYRVFQLDGTPLYTYVPQQGPFPAGDVRCAPTVGMITGYPNPVFFAAGGSNQEVSCVDLTNGSVVWSRNVNNVGPSGMFGAVRFGVFTLLNIGGTDVVYWGTDNGKLVAANALDGSLYTGWATNPQDLTQSTWASGATDGTNLYYGTYTTAVQGDIYSVDAATGNINWQLSSAGGLQGGAIWTANGGSDFGDEAFSGGVSYDAQRDYLYANSRTAGSDYPDDGIFYRIKAATGDLAGTATLANRVLYATPVVDANRVYVASFPGWSPPPAGGTIYAVNKATGAVDWAVPGGPDDFPYYCSGVLSCEPNGVADQLFVFGYEGYMSCLNAETGDELFRRRVESTPGYGEQGGAGALVVDGNGDSHLLYADLWGNLFDLTKQADRPRLEFETYTPQVAVDFGPATSYIATIPGFITNTGCADLNITAVNVDDASFGVDVPSFAAGSEVNNQTFDRTANIADQLTAHNRLLKMVRPATITPGNETAPLSVRNNTTERSVDHTAAGFPTFMNGVVHPAVGDVIAPGDTADLVLDIIQANVNRGPQTFYIQLGTNDPDFFLNDPSLLPQVFVTVVGGCLIDTTTLDFGAGGANFQLVTNTGRIANGDWGDGASGSDGLYIDGEGVTYYQGSYVWAVSTHRIATNSEDWTAGGGEADAFVSMQADPNWCDNDCKPFLNAGVTLGYSSADGLTYTPVTGNMVCKSFLDSVQNFDEGAGWDWTNFGAPFDNDSTMGLYAVGKVVGAVDAPAEVSSLDNLTLELLTITERNGRSVPGWYMGEFWDCDLGGDHVAIDRSISTAWCYSDDDPTFVWGMVKVPFGCGQEPIINTFETWGNSSAHHGFWDWTQYWDTCYTMLSSPPGAYYFTPNGDEEAHMTYAEHDFAPNETYKIGVAHFALYGLTDGSSSAEFADMAKLVNKWAGFGRGDVNNDGVINLADIIYLAGTVNGGPGAIPFQDLSDVNNDGSIDQLDVQYLIDYYFNCGPCPVGDFAF